VVSVFTTTVATLPCSWNVDVSCCDEWATYNDTIQQAASEYGALTVWAATGRRFGLCERTVRPCGRVCSNMQGNLGYYWSEGTWYPYIFNGIWRNCWCGENGMAGCCTCEPFCQTWLPGPVYSIPVTGVSQDGAVVPVDSWRVDNGEWLVRTDGECWPQCQNYDVDSGDNTFFVTYLQGIPVPSVLLRAAGELACEWARACTGAACRLPQRVTSISRQGVTISLADVNQLLENGLTGIVTVDQVIRSFNPYRLASKMRVSSPDLPVVRTTTYP
jgi:hypothetical protein